MGQNSHALDADALSSALRTLLRPLVRILLRNGVAFKTFMGHAKKVYVDVALQEMAVEGRKPSHSRASVLTGLTRKEVARLAGAASGIDVATHQSYNRAARVLTGWVRDRRFHDGSGRPASLPFDGGKRSFSELVRVYSGDMPARAVLDELVRVGAVHEFKNGRIKLLTRAYVPRTGEREKLDILGTDVAALISTIDHNLTHAPGDSFYQMKVSYDNLPEEALERLRKDAARRSQGLLEELDRRWSRQDRDVNPEVDGTGRKVAMLGIYYFEEDHDDAQ
jgi:hypothetical protein